MQLEQFYQEVILDHYKHPQNRGLREPFGAQVHHVNPTCGDEITLRVALTHDGERVADISYDGQGCSISQAATSVLTAEVIGLGVPQALEKFDAFHEMVSSRGAVDGDEDVLGDGVAFAGVAKYPARVKCALLGWMAFKDALGQALEAEPAAEQTPAAARAKAGTEEHPLASAGAATQAPRQPGAGSTVEMD
jgi:nitrogen fixation NifU-like protein